MMHAMMHPVFVFRSDNTSMFLQAPWIIQQLSTALQCSDCPVQDAEDAQCTEDNRQLEYAVLVRRMLESFSIRDAAAMLQVGHVRLCKYDRNQKERKKSKNKTNRKQSAQSDKLPLTIENARDIEADLKAAVRTWDAHTLAAQQCMCAMGISLDLLAEPLDEPLVDNTSTYQTKTIAEPNQSYLLRVDLG